MSVKLEHLDRLPTAMVDNVQGVDRILPGAEVQAVCPAILFFCRVYRSGARAVRLPVEPLLGRCCRKKDGRRLVADFDKADPSVGDIARRKHPLPAWDHRQIFRTYLTADKSDIAGGVAICPSRFGKSQYQGDDSSQPERWQRFHDSSFHAGQTPPNVSESAIEQRVNGMTLLHSAQRDRQWLRIDAAGFRSAGPCTIEDARRDGRVVDGGGLENH